MLKNHRLAKHLADATFGEIRRQLFYKKVLYGNVVHVIDGFYPSSKQCSCCGAIKTDLTLADRTYICEMCGMLKERSEWGNEAASMDEAGSWYNMKPKIVADTKLATGEAPLWHPMEAKLYWLDIPHGCILRYDPTAGNHEQVYKGEVIGGFTIQEDGALLLCMEKGAVKIWRNGELTTVIDEIPDERDTRFNDVIADPEGRVFCGTMPAKDHLGRLYRLDTDGSLTKILDDIGISNGMGFTPDRKQMYYTDSAKGEIYLFDYEQESGNISNQKVFLKIREPGVEPDGLTVDAEGYIWSARWNGSCLVRIAPDGTEDFRITFPAKKVSSLTFGGKDYKDIYITTAGGDNREEEGLGAGALFHLNLDIQGVPEFFSRIGIGD